LSRLDAAIEFHFATVVASSSLWQRFQRLRNPARASTAETRTEIEDTLRRIKTFAEEVHSGRITAENGKRFEHVLHIGIGRSALGPQFVLDALSSSQNRINNVFFDNTDPEAFDRVFDRIGEWLAQMLVVVVSKIRRDQRNTKRNAGGGSEVRGEGLQFAKHAVAMTGVKASGTNMLNRMNGSRVP
jgi:glucose-6-phosphate isomerase